MTIGSDALIARTICATLAFSLVAQVGSIEADKSNRLLQPIERKVRAQLQWEILWDVAGAKFRARPASGVVRLAFHSTGKHLFYCSEDLGRCAKYRLENHEINGPVADGECSRNAEEALDIFLRLHGETPVSRTALQQPLRLDGPLRLPTAMAWSAQLSLPSREELLNLNYARKSLRRRLFVGAA